MTRRNLARARRGHGDCIKMKVMPNLFRHRRLVNAAVTLGLICCASTSLAQTADDKVLQAREALRGKDKTALVSAKRATLDTDHPLALWVDYWELNNRLADTVQPVQQAELNAFYARWPGTYVEDRLRNDWLLELGKRRDWANFAVEFPRFRMNDDREVTCYALLTQHQAGQDVAAAARAAWWAQRDADDGCQLLASTLFDAGALSAQDVWLEARLSIEGNRQRAARNAVGLLHPVAAGAVDDLFKDPQRYLSNPAARPTGLAAATAQELAVLALLRLAAADPDAAAVQLQTAWQARLLPEQAASAWAQIGKSASMKQLPGATDHYSRAWALWGQAGKAARIGGPAGGSDDALAWAVRAALRLPAGQAERWPQITRAISAMGADEQRDSAWVYWQARAAWAQAAGGVDGDPARAAARQALGELARQMNFYGKLATEDLGGRVTLPLPPQPLTSAERDAARSHPGLRRALQLIAIGLRNEGVREWNFSLRGMADRQLLAAAQTACEREVWDRCINTSERTKAEVDMAQRFPTPLREQVLAQAQQAGIDPAFMYGLIRQESRFIMDTRSHVGASGLMQVMPATASWTARKIGLDYKPGMIADRDINLRLGSAYLKLVLDDFGGSQPLAAAAYNAGPNRPRRWREGAAVEPAAWAESIPFLETRDYVKKVLSNAVYYSAVLGPTAATASTLKARLGPMVGPRDTSASAPARDLP